MGVSVLVGAIMIPYATACLGAELFGVYAVLGSVLALLNLLDLGLSGAVSRFSSQDQGAKNVEQLRETVSTGMLILGGAGLIGAVTLVLSLPLVRAFFTRIQPDHYDDLTAIAVCLAINFALRFVSFTMRGVLVGANRYDFINGVEIASNVVRLVLLLFFFSFFEATLLLFGMTFIAHQLIRVIGFHIFGERLVGAGRLIRFNDVTRRAVGRLGGFSAVNAVAVLGGVIILQGPVVIIGRMLGTEYATLFYPAIFVGSQLRSIIGGLCSPLIPLAAKDAVTGEGKGLAGYSIRLSRISSAFALGMLIPVGVLTWPLIQHWLGEEFLGTEWVFLVMVFGQLVASIQSANYFLLMGGSKMTSWAISQLIAAVIGIIIAAGGQWYYDWGLLGISLSVTAVVVARNLIYLPVLACRQFQTPILDYFWYVYVKPFALASLLAAIAYWLILLFPPGNLVVTIMYGSAIVLAFAPIAWFGIIAKSDRETIIGLIRSGKNRLTTNKAN